MQQWGCSLMILEAPFNPSHSMIFINMQHIDVNLKKDYRKLCKEMYRFHKSFTFNERKYPLMRTTDLANLLSGQRLWIYV